MQRLSYPTDTVLSNKITRNRIVLSFKDSARKPLGRRHLEEKQAEHDAFSNHGEERGGKERRKDGNNKEVRNGQNGWRWRAIH